MQISVNITLFNYKDHFRFSDYLTFADYLQITVISSVFKFYIHLLVLLHASTQNIHCFALLYLCLVHMPIFLRLINSSKQEMPISDMSINSLWAEIMVYICFESIDINKRLSTFIGCIYLLYTSS